MRLLLLSLVTLPLSLFASPTPTILSTDIGSDIDDTWALAHILRSPEIDLKLVITETGEPSYRAAIVAKLLETANRSDVPVALGAEAGTMADKDRHQGPWIKDYALAAYPGTVHQDGIQALIDTIRASEQTINIIAIGPVPNLAKAVSQAPDIAEKCHLFGMHGSVDIGYGGDSSPSAEYNVVADVPAFRTVLAAPWKSITLTPLDTCGLMNLSGEDYHRVWSATDDPLLRSVIENYCIWAPRVPWMNCDFFTQKSSTLFDDVAVFMSYSQDFIEYENITFSVTDDGYTRRDPNGPYSAKFAMHWKNLPAFQSFLSHRLTSK